MFLNIFLKIIVIHILKLHSGHSYAKFGMQCVASCFYLQMVEDSDDVIQNDFLFIYSKFILYF